jgi:hypothetical protein
MITCLTLILALLAFSSPVIAKECPTNSFELEKASKACKIQRFCETLFRDFQHDLVMYYRYDLCIEKIGRNSRVIDLTKDQSYKYEVLKERQALHMKDILPNSTVYNNLCKK